MVVGKNAAIFSIAHCSRSRAEAARERDLSTVRYLGIEVDDIGTSAEYVIFKKSDLNEPQVRYILPKDVSEPIIHSSRSKKQGDAQMKGKIFGLLAAGLLAGPITASATPSYAPVDFLGTLDVTCVGYGPNCGTGGVIPLFGSLSSSGMVDIGIAANPTLFAGTLSGSNTFTGVATSLDGDVYDWTFTRTIAPVTSPIVGDWSGTGTPVVIGGGNGATELADVVITGATKAPEIDPASAVSGLTLLVGGLIVLRGRKQQRIAA